jgi:hypothetical protein
MPSGARYFVVMLFCFYCGTKTCAAPNDEGPDALLPDPDLQIHIHRLATLSTNKIEFYQEVIALNAITRQPPDGRDHLLRQIVLYCVRKGGEPRALYQAKWQLRFDDHLFARYMLPYLDTPDEKLREFILTQILRAYGEVYELPASDDRVHALRSYIQEHLHRGAEPPWRAVQILYWKAPSEALLCFAPQENMQVWKSFSWTKHLITDVVWKQSAGFLKPGEIEVAQAELDKVSKIPEWWARLYVAEMFRRYEFLRRDDILERLRADPNPLIAKAADIPFHHGRSKGELENSPKR